MFNGISQIIIRPKNRNVIKCFEENNVNFVANVNDAVYVQNEETS